MSVTTILVIFLFFQNVLKIRNIKNKYVNIMFIQFATLVFFVKYKNF